MFFAPVVLTIYTGRGVIFFIVILDCWALSLLCVSFSRAVKDPSVGVPASRWQLWNSDRRRPAILIVLPGRLFISPFPFELLVVFFDGLLPRPSFSSHSIRRLYRWSFYPFDHGMGHFNPELVFCPRFSFVASRIGDGGLVQTAVTPSTPSHPMCNDGFAGGGFCVFL